MTAEIAIVNRTALALAADSAVTIRIGNKLKIYDSAEKIFEFSRRQPIGIMIYNNVEVVNVPLDVLIRKFRNEEIGVYNTHRSKSWWQSTQTVEAYNPNDKRPETLSRPSTPPIGTANQARKS